MKIKQLITFTLLVASFLTSTVQAGVIYNGSPLANVDNATPVTTTFTVLDHGTILDLDLFYTLSNDWASDVSVTLTHGATTVLAFDAFEDTPTAVDVTLDDEAAGPITAGNYFGTFQASNLLSAFDGMDVFGDWTIGFYDDIVAGDATDLTAWGISVETTAVPEPSTLAIFGLALFGLSYSARRKSKKNV